jgi:sec-independent protein translocase protein TatA
MELNTIYVNKEAAAKAIGGRELFGLGMPELILILVLALVFFGPSKLPEMGSAIGKTIHEFRHGTQEGDVPPSPAAMKAENLELRNDLGIGQPTTNREGKKA